MSTRVRTRCAPLLLALIACEMDDKGDASKQVDRSPVEAARAPDAGESDADANGPPGDGESDDAQPHHDQPPHGDGQRGDGSPAEDAGADGPPAPPPPPPPPPPVVRFVVLGDGGTGDSHQFDVAGAVGDVCRARGCDFALYLGDNIYESGVSGVDDAQFDTKFERPYAALDFPFYAALGNHDYGSSGTNLFPEDERSLAQVAYTERSGKWRMPRPYYSFRVGPIEGFALDTNAVVLERFRDAEEQRAWLDKALRDSDAPWKLVFGHHPYVSNGEHGNASSDALVGLIEGSVCGRAQIYFAGHDHDREWLEPVCGTHFIVSGAAAKLRRMAGDDQPTRYQDGSARGFLWVEVEGDTLTGVFYDEWGRESYRDTVVR